MALAITEHNESLARTQDFVTGSQLSREMKEILKSLNQMESLESLSLQEA